MDISIAWGDGPMSYHKDRKKKTTFDIKEGPKPPKKDSIVYPYGNARFENFNQTDFKVIVTGAYDTFIGLLFGKFMNASDVHIIDFLPQDNITKYIIYDGWSSKNGSPQNDIDLGGTNDIRNMEYSIIDGKPVITYLRKYKTGDQYDKDINLVHCH
jgi:hypothetical protein